jgi:hypothetical protein
MIERYMLAVALVVASALPAGRTDGMLAHDMENGATRTIVPSQTEPVGAAKTTPTAGPL